jgi:hypothetical protein
MKAPKPPGVGATTAKAQAANRDTAVTQQLLNMTGQETPYGSLSYAQTGTGPNNTPMFTATTKLTPEQQALLEQEQQFDKRFNEIGLAQTDRIGEHLSSPFTLDNNAVEGRIGELSRERLDPLWREREGQFDQKMANQGISPGSEAYANARRDFDTGRNDSYNSMLLDARRQAMQELLTGRNQPINEIGALMSGGQVQQPQFQSTPQTGVQGVDVAGLTAANYAAKNAAYQAKLGGLFGLGSAALGGWAMRGRGAS